MTIKADTSQSVGPHRLIVPQDHQTLGGPPTGGDSAAGRGAHRPRAALEADFPVRVNQALEMQGEQEGEVDRLRDGAKPALPSSATARPARGWDLTRLLMLPLLVVIADDVFQQRSGLRDSVIRYRSHKGGRRLCK